jgi:hypothetical protein
MTAFLNVDLLTHQDSNLGRENQNLLCCRYTMGHGESGFRNYDFGITNAGAKVENIFFLQQGRIEKKYYLSLFEGKFVLSCPITR